MHALDILGDPVRRHILQVLVKGECTSGTLVEHVQREFGISQPAVSQHLKVLRENGFSSVREEGTRRHDSIQPERFQEVDAWLNQFRGFWEHGLDALATEVARGKRERAKKG